MEKSTIPSGLTAAHGHSSTLGRGPTRWPNPVAFGHPMPVERGPCTASACSVHTAHGHHSRAQPARTARRGAQRRGRGQTVKMSSPSPSQWLQLLVATPNPRRGGRKEGPHRRGSWGSDNQWRRRWNNSNIGEGAPSPAP
jgi:hypothetical protein